MNGRPGKKPVKAPPLGPGDGAVQLVTAGQPVVLDDVVDVGAVLAVRGVTADGGDVPGDGLRGLRVVERDRQHHPAGGDDQVVVDGDVRVDGLEQVDGLLGGEDLAVEPHHQRAVAGRRFGDPGGLRRIEQGLHRDRVEVQS